MYNFIIQKSFSTQPMSIDTQEDNNLLFNFKTYTKKNSLGKRLKRGIRILFSKSKPTQTNDIGTGLKSIITTFKNKKVVEVSQLSKHEICYKSL